MSNKDMEIQASAQTDDKVTGKPGFSFDFTWAISLFGTAVGAGILFLPINAGAHGLWPLLVVTILIGPMTYLSHRGLSHFVCESPKKGEDITKVAVDYFGGGVGKFITILYFLAIYPIVLIYAVSITNTVDSLIVNQLGGPHIPRALLSFILLALMMAVMIKGQRLMLIVTQALVYPLIIALFVISIYLIPHWQHMTLGPVPAVGDFLKYVWIIIPVLIFAFNHSPAISQFSLSMQRTYGDKAGAAASRSLVYTAIMLVAFTMFFVWSCVFTLGASGLAEARAQNLPILSYLANVFSQPGISYAGPLIAITAIVSSFFGHYMGTEEGAVGIVRELSPSFYDKNGEKKIKAFVAGFIFITGWIVAIINPSILSLIETLSGPVIAAILYLMPMYAIYKIPALQRFRGRPTNIFVIIMGLVAIAALFYNMVA